MYNKISPPVNVTFYAIKDYACRIFVCTTVLSTNSPKVVKDVWSQECLRAHCLCPISLLLCHYKYIYSPVPLRNIIPQKLQIPFSLLKSKHGKSNHGKRFSSTWQQKISLVESILLQIKMVCMVMTHGLEWKLKMSEHCISRFECV